MGSEFIRRKSSVSSNKKYDTKAFLFTSRSFSASTYENSKVKVSRKELRKDIPPPDYLLSNFSANASQSTIQRDVESPKGKESEEELKVNCSSDEYTSPIVDQGEKEEKISPLLEDGKKEENLDNKSVQTKLTVGEPGDKYEQEADTVAAKVVQQINSPQTEQPVQGKVKPVVKPTVMCQGGVAGETVNRDVEQNIQQAQGGGQGLADNVRQPMEQAFGSDFSGVKVHTDGQADILNRSLNSRAFATGQDIFFKQGEYNPGSKQGQELLAHELTHVVQQKNACLPKIQQSGKKANLKEIPDSHILLEYVAHHVVYDHYALKDPEQSAILKRAGYNIKKVYWRTGRYGFQACLILPSSNHRKTPTPILAIRGTDSLGGLSTDFDFAQVGSNQFLANRKQISELLNLAEGSVDLTGHSLGGAVAQIIATNFPGKVRNLVTFQSPGINLSTQSKFNRLKKSEQPEHITHHIAGRDLVDFAGGGRLPGSIYEHEQQSGSPIDAHKAFLFATDTFREQRERLGLSDHFMNNEVRKNIIRKGNPSITRHRRYPYQIRRFFAEVGRSVLSFITSPFFLLFDAFSSQRPDKSGAPIASYRAMKKIRRILDRLEGWTSARDMRIILDILSTVEDPSEMLEIRRVIEPTLPQYLIYIG
ncbi:MAG: DUF4157 domain-containing protein, partial [Cyanobacteria bacterium J06639_18]